MLRLASIYGGTHNMLRDALWGGGESDPFSDLLSDRTVINRITAHFIIKMAVLRRPFIHSFTSYTACLIEQVG
jgi:hypothetical protein